VLLRVKFFMAAMNAAWSQFGVEVDDDGPSAGGDDAYSSAGGGPYIYGDVV
jgi:hypothetical protein